MKKSLCLLAILALSIPVFAEQTGGRIKSSSERSELGEQSGGRLP